MKQLDLNELSEKCKNANQLYNIMFVLLDACDHDCIHCYIPKHTSMGLPTEQIKQTIVDARKLGALSVTFTGGEILLRKDLFDLIAFARAQYMRVFLMSNGASLDESKIEKLGELGIADYSTTIFSMQPDIHDKITRREGSFARTLKNIHLLKKYNIPVTIKTPLMEINKYAYREVEEFATSNGFNFMTTTTIFSKTDGDNYPQSLQIKDGLGEIILETEKLLAKHQPYEVNTNKQGIPCSAGFNTICVNYDGTVWPCNSLLLDLGNVNHSSIIEIWNNSPELKKWRQLSVQPLKACNKCSLKNICLRCPGMALLEDGDLYGCSSAAKKIAAEKKKGGIQLCLIKSQNSKK